MTQWDLSILDWIQKQFQCAVLDRVMPCITLLGEAWAVILVALVLLAVPRTRKLGLAVALALALDGLVCNGILKPLVARPRPYTLREVSLLIAAPRDTRRQPLPWPQHCAGRSPGEESRPWCWRGSLP